MRRWVQWGVIVIIAVMPFHAFLSVWLGSVTGSQAVWQSWKEMILTLMTGATILLCMRSKQTRARLKNPLVYSVAALAVLAALITLIRQPELLPVLFGLKTNFSFLLVLTIAMVVSDRWLVQRATVALLASSSVVVLFGLLQVYVLPREFLSWFGYGPATIQPFLLIDPALGDIRILSTLGGPNQLGSFLILPLAVTVALMVRRFRWWQPVYLAAGLVVMWHSHSRSAWIGMAAAAVTIAILIPRRWRLPVVLGAVATTALSIQLALMGLAGGGKLQYYLLHSSLKDTGIEASTSLHARAINNGLHLIVQRPLGLGLGAAGPASYYGTKPIIPESYWLQIGIELGVVGLALFIIINILLGVRLWRAVTARPVAAGALGALIGMAAVNLFLHGWADSSTSLVYWAIAGALIGDQI